jgi:hypothetical protein
MYFRSPTKLPGDTTKPLGVERSTQHAQHGPKVSPPTIPPRVPENPAYRKPTHALHHNNVNICQETLKLSEYTLRTLALVLNYLLLLLSSVALTIPCLVVDVPNSLSSVSLGRAQQRMHLRRSLSSYR